MFPLSLPHWEAVEALKTDDAQCWADILEITFENATAESRKEVYCPKIYQGQNFLFRPLAPIDNHAHQQTLNRREILLTADRHVL